MALYCWGLKRLAVGLSEGISWGLQWRPSGLSLS